MTALNNLLRLEVLASDDGNEIVNHSAQAGTVSPWTLYFGTTGQTLTPASGMPFGYAGKSLKLTAGASKVTPEAVSEPFAIVGNEYANISVTFKSTDGVPRRLIAGLIWLDNSDNVIGGAPVVKDTLSSVGADAEYVVTLDGPGISRKAPSGTVKAQVYVTADTHPGQESGRYVGQNTWFYKVMAVRGSTDAAVAGPVFSDTAETWQNLLPKSISHQIVRGGDVDGVTDRLELGSITSTLKDPASTPENNPRVRPGRPIRLVRASDAKPVITATINRASTDYSGDVPVVTINTGDAMAVMGDFTQVVAKSGRFKQRVDTALLNVPVNYVVVDSAADSPSPATISVDESGTALSQLELVRDTLRGLFYVDKANVVRAFAVNSLPSKLPTVTFSDVTEPGAIYYLKKGISTSFDSKNIVNTLTVNDVRASAPKVYGPYTNQDSVDEWGPSSAQVDINSGTAATTAGNYLATYSEPSIFVESLTFNATDNIAWAIDRELYEAARVKYSPAGIDAVYRVIGIEHTITANKWLVTLKFKPMETTNVITVTNPPGGPTSGPSDLLP